jgi:two-component system CheB/CheR fusion protein
MMVVFEEVPAPATKDARRNSRPVANAERRSIEDLEDELRSVRESLQTSIEEFETSSEELRSSNEELQSTNEELETSKEELQSLNEESVTVNVELQARIDELSKANDDMKNLLDSTNIATIFLDTELRIRRFTPRATDLVPVKAADVGRPLAHLASRLPGTNLQDVGVKVLEDLSMREAEVESEDGRVYAMKARPYRTAANVIDGVVITFDDITGRKLAEKATLESEQLFRMLFDLASDSIVLVASQTGRFAQFNRRAYERLGYGPEEFANLTLTDIETGIVPEQGAGRAGEVSVPGIDVHVARHRAKDGTIQDVRVRTKVITFRNRSYILSSWHDITPVDSGG